MRLRERRFVAEYLRNADPAKAARAAGYRESGARLKGLLLLRRADVRAAVTKARNERSDRVGLTVERVLLEYARLAFGNLGRVMRSDGAAAAPLPLLELEADDAAAIAMVTFGPKGGGPASLRLHDKGFALEALCLYYNVFDAEAWRDESEGARDRLMAKLADMAAAEEEAQRPPPVPIEESAAAPALC